MVEGVTMGAMTVDYNPEFSLLNRVLRTLEGKLAMMGKNKMDELALPETMPPG